MLTRIQSRQLSGSLRVTIHCAMRLIVVVPASIHGNATPLMRDVMDASAIQNMMPSIAHHIQTVRLARVTWSSVCPAPPFSQLHHPYTEESRKYVWSPASE